MAAVFPDFPPVFELEGPSVLSWQFAFGTGACCGVESKLEREIEGNLVTFVPRFRYVPCGDRCFAWITDAGVHDFSGHSEVRFRVMGWDEDRRLVEKWDSVVPLR